MAAIFERARELTCSSVGLAARAGDEQLLRQLIGQGFPCDVSDNRGWFPIHEAASNGNHPCVLYLATTEGVDLDIQTHEGETALFLALSKGHLDVVNSLVLLGATMKPNHEEVNPLVAALKGRSLECARVCVESGCDVNSQNVSGWSALHEAAYMGSTEFLEFLLDSGAAVNIQALDGATPLFTAAQYGHVACLQLLMAKGADVGLVTVDNASPLFICAQEGHEECVSLLIKSGADLSISTKEGGTPLHTAAEQGRVACLQLLLDAGANACSLTHPDRISALHLAAQGGHYTCLEMLLSAGAEVDAKTKTSGITPLSLACTGNAKCCELLLARGADANHVCEDYDVLPKTPLMLSAEGGHADCIRTLLQHGARPNTVTYTSPLILSAQNASRECIEALLDSGADVNFADRGRNTALSISVTRLGYAMNEKQPAQQLACIALLLKAGADVAALYGGACVVFRDRFAFKVLQASLFELLLEFDGNRPEARAVCLAVCQQRGQDLNWRRLLRLASRPRPLTHLCRLTIRACAGAARLRRLHELPLPPAVIGYLLHSSS